MGGGGVTKVSEFGGIGALECLGLRVKDSSSLGLSLDWA